MSAFGLTVLILTALYIVYYAYNIMKDTYTFHRKKNKEEIIPADVEAPKKVDRTSLASRVTQEDYLPESNQSMSPAVAETSPSGSGISENIANINKEKLDNIDPAHQGGLFASDFKRILQDCEARNKLNFAYKVN